ncbi:hypothetical protein BDZ94DRAFT_355793 [Collybia nuda]|uniref:MYND-type domain-containing protein n=1 Tax=Collybia nuda TaxID=64659 RepID=A0A9P5XSZ2_9AGAR|nr:hypothetical protein BDZ94DRAFT_355793 [Collybia nuda]
MQSDLRAQPEAFSKLKSTKDNRDVGRPIEELIKTNELLKGRESERLMKFCDTEYLELARDLDRYGRLLFSGELMMVRADYLGRVAVGDEFLGSMEASQLSAANDIYRMRWGSIKVPLYNLLGLFIGLRPGMRIAYLDLARFFINDACVPVTGGDMSGTTALSHSFSTKSGLDFEYAQMLYDAGGELNNRNRHGATVAHEIIQIFEPQNKQAVNEAKRAFSWFLSHGGNIDIADTDGYTVRQTMHNLKHMLGDFLKIAESEDRRRAARSDVCCTTCGREDKKLFACGRCKKARYCEPSGRICQKVDWPRHKTKCKAGGR